MTLIAWYFITVLAVESAVVQGPFATRALCEEASQWVLQQPRVTAVSEPYFKEEIPE